VGVSYAVCTIALMALDSAPDALAVQREVWRRMGPTARVILAMEMSEEARRVALAGARSREPMMDDDELRRRQVRSLYGTGGVSASTR
jgi:hypothetical protein